jgi:hypothetical protein
MLVAPVWYSCQLSAISNQQKTVKRVKLKVKRAENMARAFNFQLLTPL